MDARPAAAETTSELASLAGKYMTFRVGGEEYGLEILKVRELIGLLEITRVPHAPHGVKGVINLRGKVIPVVDLREQLGIPPAEIERPVIIVVQLQRPSGPVTTGVLVDQVLEVRNITAAQLEPPPSFGRDDEATRFILAIAKTEKRVVLLVDIDLVLSTTSLTAAA
ncbi:MAG: chemotaxis protein CheW [Myxococcota bacterium]